ncbi:MAG: sulfate adenylyltransferase [bacterium]
MPIAPHGGKLINRVVEGKEREKLIELAPSLRKIKLSAREVSDLEMIGVGAFSPLEGFMCHKDYRTCLDFKRLENGLPWTIPVTLTVPGEDDSRYKIGKEYALTDQSDGLLAILSLEDKWKLDKEAECEHVLTTIDMAHPGVVYIKEVMNDVCLGGRISLLHRDPDPPFADNRLDPAECRVLFKTKGWKRIVAFQTRNPIHRAHEYIQKCAMETVDGLLLHPLMGETKKDDIPADVRMACYRKLLEGYYPPDRTVLSVYPAAMRYAGPREAVFHAIARKNYGCTHFIVGRDHAGVGKFYGTYAAHYIFNDYDPQEVGIVPMFFDHAFFCKNCGGMGTSKTCPHDSSNHVFLSGTKVRDMLSKGEMPPLEFTRPEIAEILAESYQKANLGMGI